MKNFLTKGGFGDLGFNFFGDAFDDFFKPFTLMPSVNNMRTDVREREDGYDISIDMPGFEKKDINLTLNKGYLKVEANREQKDEDKDSFIRRERSYSCSRSYFVGENITEEDVKAKYENGTLTLSIPKNEKKELPVKQISID